MPPSIAQQQDQIAQTRTGIPLEVIDKELIPDFVEVTPTLYRGGQPRRHAFEALAKMGIQIVVDLRGDRDAERSEVD